MDEAVLAELRAIRQDLAHVRGLAFLVAELIAKAVASAEADEAEQRALMSWAAAALAEATRAAGAPLPPR